MELPINQIICGDNLETMRTWPDACIDSIVTDPPYGLSFMGKKWDYDVPGVEVWAECLRVLKPGGHLLAFAGTRTQHRMAVRIEDAGFEIRDMIAWVYGSGFPKSMNVAKAVQAYETRGSCSMSDQRKAAMGDDYSPSDVVGMTANGIERSMNCRRASPPPITAPATEAAKQWAGWGTALKPALEPITVARKPLDVTVAENVLRFGTGAINVDGCRVGTDDGQDRGRPPRTPNAILGGGKGTNLTASEHNAAGRWPANLIHDGSDEVVGLFPQSGNDSGPREAVRGGHKFGGDKGQNDTLVGRWHGDSGSAARFFYTAKADKAERGRHNNHPTVKPVDLMRYLVRLVTPIGAIVLDPFSGSGTTCVAAKLEFVKFIGIEREAGYVAISSRRLEQGVLF